MVVRSVRTSNRGLLLLASWLGRHVRHRSECVAKEGRHRRWHLEGGRERKTRNVVKIDGLYSIERLFFTVLSEYGGQLVAFGGEGRCGDGD